MSEKLGRQRGELEIEYAKANDAVADAQKKCRQASDSVQKFDEAHPEVMRAFHDHVGADKKAIRAKAIAEAAEEGAET